MLYSAVDLYFKYSIISLAFLTVLLLIDYINKCVKTVNQQCRYHQNILSKKWRWLSAGELFIQLAKFRWECYLGWKRSTNWENINEEFWRGNVLEGIMLERSGILLLILERVCSALSSPRVMQSVYWRCFGTPENVQCDTPVRLQYARVERQLLRYFDDASCLIVVLQANILSTLADGFRCWTNLYHRQFKRLCTERSVKKLTPNEEEKTGRRCMKQ